MNPSQRLLPIDAVRGTVTFFVGVSHISYFFIVSKPLFFGVLRRRRLGKPVAPRLTLGDSVGASCLSRLYSLDDPGLCESPFGKRFHFDNPERCLEQHRR
jgi:hypothetical protein